MVRLSAVILPLLFLVSACKSPQTTKTSSFKDSLISMRTTPCFGRCPVYELEIQSDGLVEFMGKQYCTKMGAYSKQLSPEKTKALFESLMASNFFERPDAYDEPTIADLSSTFLGFKHQGQEKTINCRYNIPSEIKEILRELRHLAESDGWTAKTNE